MKAYRILIPASLILLAASPASALTPAWNAGVAGSTSIVAPIAKYGKWYYACNKYFGSHDLQRCYEMHGLNDKGQRMKSGL
jgi:hypothetical protein